MKRGRISAAELSVVPPQQRPPRRNAPQMPPNHLKPSTKDWWRLISANFNLEKYQYAVLQSACEAWDLYQHARDQLTKKGLTFTDKKGMVRARPEAAISRDARTSFLRALRELKLDVESPMSPGDRMSKNKMHGPSRKPWDGDGAGFASFGV